MSRKISALFVFMLLLPGAGLPKAWANTQYELRVDGMACPYCAYGIEKKLKALDGVIRESLQVKLNDGVVKFEALDDVPITEPVLKKLINDSGFTLRSVSVLSSNPKKQVAEH